MKKKCKHEYRTLSKPYDDVSTNQAFYCVYCLELVYMTFFRYAEVIKNPKVKKLVQSPLWGEEERYGRTKNIMSIL